MSSILTLTGSPRRGGNSDLLAEAFMAGAREAGHQVTLFEAGRSRIGGCVACDTCYSKGRACTFDDDFNTLAPMLERADSLVLVTPLYWFSFPTQLKAALDKLYAMGQRCSVGKAAMIVCGETGDMADFDGIVRSFELICAYKGWADHGRLLVPSVNKKGDVKATDFLEKARDMGRTFLA